jgi:hypothetical protein
MTKGGACACLPGRHREERSDVAISISPWTTGKKADCFASLAMTKVGASARLPGRHREERSDVAISVSHWTNRKKQMASLRSQ